MTCNDFYMLQARGLMELYARGYYPITLSDTPKKPDGTASSFRRAAEWYAAWGDLTLAAEALYNADRAERPLSVRRTLAVNVLPKHHGRRRA